jgi:hypothetical protein
MRVDNYRAGNLFVLDNGLHHMHSRVSHSHSPLHEVARAGGACEEPLPLLRPLAHSPNLGWVTTHAQHLLLLLLLHVRSG